MWRRWCVAVGVLLLAGCGRSAPSAGGGPYVAVIDARGDQPGGQVHLVDVQTRKLVASRKVEAPDGLFDPATGDLLLGTTTGLQRLKAGTWESGERLPTAFHSWWKFLPEASQYAMNPDGRRLHFIAYHPAMAAGGPGRLAVQTVDLKAARVEPEVIEIPPCAGRLVVPTASRGYAVCMDGTVTELLLDQAKTGGGVHAGKKMGQRNPVAGAFWHDGGLLLIWAGGQVRRVTPGMDVTELTDLPFPQGLGVPGGQVALSPDGARLYVGVGDVGRCVPGCPTDDLVAARHADLLQVYSTRTWRLESTWTTRPFLGLAAVGDQLIMTSAAERRVWFLDPATGQETGAITGVGRAPSLILR